MQQFRSPRSVALTALAVALIAIGIGGLVSGQAFASNAAPWMGGPWKGGGRHGEFQSGRVELTHGTVTAFSPSSLTVSTADGASYTFTLNAETTRRGTSINPNDAVVVVTQNGSTTAAAVFPANGRGFGPRGPWGH